MKADRVEVSRDEQANRWLIRIQVGEEVCSLHLPLNPRILRIWIIVAATLAIRRKLPRMRDMKLIL